MFSPSKQHWAEHMPVGEPRRGRVKRVSGATQLTPWRKEHRPLWNGLLKCGGHHSGGPKEDKRVRETQNPLWQTELGVGHKPQTGSSRIRRYFHWMYLHRQNTLYEWNTDDRDFHFPCLTLTLTMPSVIMLSWIMAGKRLELFIKYVNCVTSQGNSAFSAL